MGLKAILPSILRIKNIYFLSSLLIFMFMLQVIINHKKEEKVSTVELLTVSELEKEYRKRFNLMDGPAEVVRECSLDYINEHKLAQDHPCVLELIRHLYMTPPPPNDIPYNLTNITPHFTPGKRDGRKTEALLMENKKEGFFVECGAFDGFFLANTLDLELNQRWTGLLIEASPKNYQKLMTRNRKTWTSNACLSLMPFPTKISFTTSENPAPISNAVFRIIEKDKDGKNIYDHQYDKVFGITTMETVTVQCFPFYSLLLALNQTTVDYFSLDIEGHEKRVLETIPWNRVNIKIMRIETTHIPEENNITGSEALQNFLEGEPGYLNFRILSDDDELYIKNYFREV